MLLDGVANRTFKRSVGCTTLEWCLRNEARRRSAVSVAQARPKAITHHVAVVTGKPRWCRRSCLRLRSLKLLRWNLPGCLLGERSWVAWCRCQRPARRRLWCWGCGQMLPTAWCRRWCSRCAATQSRSWSSRRHRWKSWRVETDDIVTVVDFLLQLLLWHTCWSWSALPSERWVLRKIAEVPISAVEVAAIRLCFGAMKSVTVRAEA
jgi:hypothetical protein